MKPSAEIWVGTQAGRVAAFDAALRPLGEVAVGASPVAALHATSGAVFAALEDGAIARITQSASGLAIGSTSQLEEATILDLAEALLDGAPALAAADAMGAVVLFAAKSLEEQVDLAMTTPSAVLGAAGKILAGTAAGELRLWDPDDGRAIATFPPLPDGGEVRHLCALSERTVAALSQHGALYFYDLSTPDRAPRAGMVTAVSALAPFDAARVVAAHHTMLSVVSAHDGLATAVSGGFEGGIEKLAGRDGMVVVASADRLTVLTIDAAGTSFKGRRLATAKTSAAVTALSWAHAEPKTGEPIAGV